MATKLKCLACGCVNDLNAGDCTECGANLGDPTIDKSSAPRQTRKTTNY